MIIDAGVDKFCGRADSESNMLHETSYFSVSTAQIAPITHAPAFSDYRGGDTNGEVAATPRKQLKNKNSDLRKS